MGRDAGARDADELPTGTVTFLLTDVEGSTPLWDADPARMAVAMRRHEELLASAVRQHGGVRPLEQGEGDNVVAAFARASDAAQAAIDAQRALLAEPGFAVRVRMALHTGEAHLQEGRTYAGPDLNRCARLRGLAHGSQIVVSRTTHDLLADAAIGGVTFRDLGSYRLRGLERPEQVHQLCHPDLPDAFPPLHAADVLASTLPRPATPLIGRVTERDEVLQLFAQAQLVTLAGSGGCGKTRLAIEVGECLGTRSPDGVWWVDLSGVADPTLVAGTILAGLGRRDEGGADPATTLATFIDAKELTLVLDNVEHLLDECARVLAIVVGRCPAVRVLVTSREPIGLDCEWAYRVPSLGVPQPDAAVDVVAASDAVRLFEARASQARPGFVVAADNAVPVGQICRRLDGIPLAIELAAVRVRAMSVDQIASGLDDRFRLLAGGGRRAIPRQATLLASVEWSYGLLDDAERRCLRRLAAFVGGFTLEAAEAVVADEQLDAHAVLELITRLVDKSVVLAPAEGGAPLEGNGVSANGPRRRPRYRLLETIRQFAHAQLDAAEEVAAVRDRHLAWARELTTAAEPELTGRAQAEWLDLLEDEHDNLRAAADWATATRDGATLWAMAGHLAFFWVLHGHFVDAVHVVERAQELSDGVPEAMQLAGRWASAYVALYAGAYERGYVEALEVIERASALGDDRILGRALDTLATIEMFIDLIGARAHLEQAIPLARAAGDDWCLSDALQIVGFSFLLQGAPSRGADAMREAREIAERLDNQQLLGWDHFFHGFVSSLDGRLDDAQRGGEAALRSAELCGDPAIAANALVLLADVAVRRGHAVKVVPVLTEALERLRSTGGSQSVPMLSVRLAATLAASGHLEDASAQLESAAEDLQQGGGQFDRLQLAEVRARVCLALGEHDGATQAALETQALARQLENEAADAIARISLGWVALRCDRLKEADQLAHAAVAALFAAGHRADCADAVMLCGLVAAALDRPVEATRLLAAAAAVVQRTGAVATNFTAVLGQPDTEALAARLGEEAFAAAWAEGSALGLDEVASMVARRRGSRRRPPLGWDSLTPTELSVVELAAEGLTNKAIAERLFVSPATVKTHLAHVFAKVDMANRAELTAEVVRRRHQAEAP